MHYIIFITLKYKVNLLCICTYSLLCLCIMHNPSKHTRFWLRQNGCKTRFDILMHRHSKIYSVLLSRLWYTIIYQESSMRRIHLNRKQQDINNMIQQNLFHKCSLCEKHIKSSQEKWTWAHTVSMTHRSFVNQVQIQSPSGFNFGSKCCKVGDTMSTP